MSEVNELIADILKLQYPFKVTNTKVIMHAKDFSKLLSNPIVRFNSKSDIIILGKNVLIYNTEEEFVWKIILEE